MKACCISALLLILLLSFNTDPDPGCAKFKKGNFFYKSINDTELYRVERDDSIQKETRVSSGDYILLKILWVNPCEYDLTFLSQHILKSDSIIKPIQELKLKTRIVRTLNDSCFLESQFISDPTHFTIKGVLYMAR